METKEQNKPCCEGKSCCCDCKLCAVICNLFRKLFSCCK